MTLEEFESMVAAHDLTFEYSDDRDVWRAGCRSLDRINQAAKSLNRADVVRIWNAAVDRKIIEGQRDSFYWRA